MKKVRLILNIAVFCLIIGFLSVMFLVSPDEKMSVAERRPLKSFEDVTDGKNHPFDEFESYFLDQFPYRDSFRAVKAFVFTDLLRKNDNNNIYEYDGTVIEIQDKLEESKLEYAMSVFNDVIDVYFEDDNVYYSIIPDKHYFASQQNGYPAMDYEKLFATVNTELDRAEYIDIIPLLELSDYYKTDSHWSQDKISDVAQKLVSGMNPDAVITPENGWKTNTLSPFYGVYYGQSALALPPEEIKYLSSEMTDNMVMYVIVPEIDKKTGTIIGKKEKYPVYITEMFSNNDPYDVFMAGAKELIVIENPMSDNDRELVIFRDSFGSSISPLIASAYSKVTLVDLRYTTPDRIKSLTGFGDDTDVLFLYSTGMLNSGAATLKRFENKQAVISAQTAKGLYTVDGYAVEAKEPDMKQVEYAVGVIDNIREKLLDESNNVYVSVIPDKHYCVSRDNGRDTSYFDGTVSYVKDTLEDVGYIDISQKLSLADYYKTDSHWNQIEITDVANTLLSAMNDDIAAIDENDFAVKKLSGFGGVYHKNTDLELEKEDLKCFTGGYIDSLTAKYLDNRGQMTEFPVYAKSRFSNTEQYDFFLGGAQTVVTLENENAKTDKELVVFRDSYGSSIAPLLADAYKKVTLVDIRYIQPDYLDNFGVEFSNKDVLFLYSADILNGGRILKNFLK